MRARGLNFWLLVVAFGAPFVAGWLFVLNPAWLPGGGGGANHGELIVPARSMEGVTLRNTQGEAVPVGSVRGQWTLLLAAQRCEVQCREMLWKMRQVRRALGADRKRVARLLVLDDLPAGALTQLLRSEYPAMPVFRPAGDDLGSRLSPAKGVVRGLFVIDPGGNLMMRYALSAPAEGMLDDLQRLLKVSKHWGEQ